jgi:hypothetical protein
MLLQTLAFDLYATPHSRRTNGALGSFCDRNYYGQHQRKLTKKDDRYACTDNAPHIGIPESTYQLMLKWHARLHLTKYNSPRSIEPRV